MDTTETNYSVEAKLAEKKYGIILKLNDYTYSTLVLVQNRHGVHARPSAEIVKLVNKYPRCEIFAEVKNSKINAKHILDWMTFEATKGTEIKLTAKDNGSQSGEDCVKVLEEIVSLFDSKFAGRYED